MPDLGKLAYDAYCKSSGGKSLVTGDALPDWYALKDEIRRAWTAAAEAVRDICCSVVDGL